MKKRLLKLIIDALFEIFVIYCFFVAVIVAVCFLCEAPEIFVPVLLIAVAVKVIPMIVNIKS